MSKIARSVLVLLGILTALFGAGVDYILPGTSPGLNLPQLLIIGGGLGLALGAYRVGRAGARRRSLPAGTRRGLGVALLLTIVTLLALELALTLAGISTYAPREARISGPRTHRLNTCDEAGCRAIYENVAEACARGERSGRYCIVNRQGFADDEDFVVGEDFAERLKVLMLGDSFTQGYSADVGRSFVEIIEARLPDAVVWNASYTTTGTNQALASFDKIGPILQPELTVLGFYMNDFEDNLTPVDSWFETYDLKGRRVFVRPYRIDFWGNLVRLDEAAAATFAAEGKYPPVNDIERMLGSSRLGTLALKLRDSIAMLQYADRIFAAGVDATRENLRQLRDSASAQSSALLVLVIPARQDVTAPSEAFTAAIGLMEELQLPYMQVLALLDSEGDYAPLPDIHWNNAGHFKVGTILGNCIQVFRERGSLDDCDFVVRP